MPQNFSTGLMTWYRRQARDLPWRRTKDPYKIWISEVMLQQTTVAAVIPYYERWMKRFLDVRSVAQASLDQILGVWQGLGYYERARNIHRSAKQILKKHGGKIPQDPHVLARLPGFGPYTMGAVLSIAFDQRQPIIDANIRRVGMRLIGLRGPAGRDPDKKVLDFLNRTMPQRHNGIFNQALMELGALVCRPLVPLCGVCPVNCFCQAFQKGVQGLIPPPRKQKIETMTVAVALIRKADKVFIQKRGRQGPLAGLWEFPGGKVEKNETPRAALEREVREELNCSLKTARHRFKIRHAYTRFRVILDVWECELKRPPRVNSTHRWALWTALHRYPLPAGTMKIIQKFREGT